MDSQDLMMRSLKKLLPHKETLLYPISGMIRDGRVYRSAFLGLTENFLLIAYMSGDNLVYHDRVPLNISSVRIRKSLGYTIDISFEDHEPMHIHAPAKMRKLSCQAENILGFCSTIKDRSPIKEGYKLSSLEGTKIRMQYFNTYLYTLAAFIPLLCLIVLGLTWNDPRYSLVDTLSGIIAGFIAMSPIILLSILNRYIFGAIVCTLHKDGIYLKNERIPWKEIQSIRYIPEVPHRHNWEYCRLCVVRKKESGKEFTTDIQHFPYYGFRKIRQMRPHLEATYDWSAVHTILIAGGIGLVVIACVEFFGQ